MRRVFIFITFFFFLYLHGLGQAKLKFYIVCLADPSSSTAGNFKSVIDDYLDNCFYLRHGYLQDYKVLKGNQSAEFEQTAIHDPRNKEVFELWPSQYIFILEIKKDILLNEGKSMKITVSVINAADKRKTHISDLILYKEDIKSCMENLSEQVFDKIVGGSIKLADYPSLVVVTNIELYRNCNNYQSICAEILKDTTLKKALFVFIDDNEFDASLKADREGKDLVIRFIIHRATKGTGKFFNIDNPDLELERVHQFCTYLKESYHATKNTPPFVN